MRFWVRVRSIWNTRLRRRRSRASLCRHFSRREFNMDSVLGHWLSEYFDSFRNSGGSGDSREKDDDEYYSLLLDDNDSGRTGSDAFFGSGKDAIAEPLYGLLGEVFDLRGVFRWLRRSLITFVQITYGRTINRYEEQSLITHFFSRVSNLYYLLQ